ncbi:MAG: carbohydrate-binding protein [Acidobacteriota bacterium]
MLGKPQNNEKASTLVMVLVVLMVLLSVGTTMLMVAGPETLSLHPGTAGGNNGGETGEVVPVVVYKVYAQATDSLIHLQPGNVIPVANDTWQIQLSQGQLKAGFSASDLTVGTAAYGLPAGLNWSLDSFDLGSNTMTISVTGTATNPINPSAKVEIIVKGSAVTIQGASDSDPIAVQLLSANINIIGEAVDKTIYMAGPQHVTVDPADNTWTIHLSQGAVKEGIVASDIQVNFPPAAAGLTVINVVYETGNIIKITVGGTAGTSIHTAINNISIVVKTSAIMEMANADATITDFSILPRVWQIQGTVTDNTVTTQGDLRNISAADPSWTINVTSGTVKSTAFNASDLTITGLPAGLTWNAAKGAGNTIEVTVSGTASSNITSIANSSIVINPSALDPAEMATAQASNALTGMVLPGYFQIAGTPTDNTVSMLLPGNTSVDAANRTWTINVTSGTVKTTVAAVDLVVYNMPTNLTYTAAKGVGNTIVVTVAGTASPAITTARTNIQILIKKSAVTDIAALDSAQIPGSIPGFIVQPGTFVLTGTASTNNTITMQGSPHTNVAATDNTWTVNVTNGTVSTGVTGANITINNLPAGLTYTAAKGAGNTIVVTVSGTAGTAIHTALTNISMVILPSAVDQFWATQSAAITGFSIQVGTWQIAGNAADSLVVTQGNCKSIGNDNQWVLNVTNGTVKPALTAADLTITGLPTGISCTAAKGTGNTIVITVSGTANNVLTGIVTVGIVIRSTAVTETQATNSVSISCYIDPSLDPILIELNTTDIEPYVGTYPLKLTSTSSSVTIYYTINGGDPRHGTEYYPASPPNIGPGTFTVQAVGRIGGQFRDESYAIRTFNNLTQPAEPTASEHSNMYYDGSGWVEDPNYALFPYASTQTIIATSTAGARIYYTYTNDGTTPGDPKASTTYWTSPGSVTLDTDTWVRAIAWKNGQWSTYGGDVALGTMRTWQVGIAYTAGQNVYYQGVIYRCVQGHTSQADWQPNLVPALWAPTATTPTEGFVYGFDTFGC